MSADFIISFCFCFLFICYANCQIETVEDRATREPKTLTLNQLRYVSKLSNMTHFNRVLDKILIPRVVGTETHEKVFKYIVKALKNSHWHVEIDEFEEDTPNIGRLNFKNIIGTLNPDAEKFLVLACHYDSKYFPNGEFLGATDSAVPCSMMLNLIQVMRNEFRSIKERDDLSLKLIFFDGEEAFENWGPNDSIYGAKHLAEKLEKTKKKSKSGKMVNELSRIDTLVLLDLIGTKNPTFYSFYRNTKPLFLMLARAEHRLANAGQLKKYSARRDQYFRKEKQFGNIEDDHLPFLARGVPILHLIAVPFPKVWHTFSDNREALDMPTIENLNKILRVFIAEYLDMLVSKN